MNLSLLLMNVIGQTDAASGSEANGSPLSATTSLFDYVQSGGILGYVLIVLSVVGLALMIRNLFVIRKSVLAPPVVVQRIEDMARAKDLSSVRQICLEPKLDSFYTNVLRDALERTEQSAMGMIELPNAIEDAIGKEGDRVHRYNDGLAIIAAVGPMLGLLGTVIGMIGAFRSIGELEGSARSTELAKFMSLALVNTAQGLIVAIPCTVAFALFRRRIDALIADVGTGLERLGARMASMPNPAARQASRVMHESAAAASVKAAVPVGAALPKTVQP